MAFNAYQQGLHFEDLAAQFMEIGLGYRVILERARAGRGEVDFVVDTGAGLIAIEVKGSRYSGAEERVHYNKKRLLQQALFQLRAAGHRVGELWVLAICQDRHGVSFERFVVED